MRADSYSRITRSGFINSFTQYSLFRINNLVNKPWVDNRAENEFYCYTYSCTFLSSIISIVTKLSNDYIVFITSIRNVRISHCTSFAESEPSAVLAASFEDSYVSFKDVFRLI